MQLFIRANQQAVVANRENAEVLLESIQKRGTMALPIKARHGIRTKEGKGIDAVVQFVPEFFQANGSIEVFLRPKQGCHFPKDAHMLLASGCLHNQVPHSLSEILWLRPAIQHDLRQRFSRIEPGTFTLCLDSMYIHSHFLQSFLKKFIVGFRGKEKAGFVCSQPCVNKCVQTIQEKSVRLIELQKILFESR